ncbi:MFS transporter [soil metagenome]|jgi:UMF1 family MFS transporter|nr:MFS transporter [Acidobacteriota bacterium]
MNPIKSEKNDRREIFGWLMYDWANSVFFTTVVSALIGQYITVLAQQAVGENGVVLNLGIFGTITAKALFPYAVGLSVFAQVFFLPLMGAIADYTNLKKTFMAFFCYLGVFATCLLFFVDGNLYLMGTVFFIFANLSAGASIVFYNSYLPDITTEDKRDKISSWGFAAGYISGSLILVANLLLLQNAENLGITINMAVRICLLTAGIWWGGFAIITFTLLKKRRPVRDIPPGKNALFAGVSELGDTFRQLFKLKHTLLFLIAYLLYNDGIQTVISQSGVFLSQELFVAKGLPIDTSFLLISLLIAQIVGLFGALAFEKIAAFTSTKTAIIISLVIWSLVVIYAYMFLDTITQAYIMSGAIGFVLGGSQALSRSLFSKMIPVGRESAFFGIYEISERGTSWIGPVVFGFVAQMTNSYRQAILALIFFFVVGSIILFFTNTDRAIHEAGNLTPEEAAGKT